MGRGYRMQQRSPCFRDLADGLANPLGFGHELSPLGFEGVEEVIAGFIGQGGDVLEDRGGADVGRFIHDSLALDETLHPLPDALMMLERDQSVLGPLVHVGGVFIDGEGEHRLAMSLHLFGKAGVVLQAEEELFGVQPRLVIGEGFKSSAHSGWGWSLDGTAGIRSATMTRFLLLMPDESSYPSAIQR